MAPWKKKGILEMLLSRVQPMEIKKEKRSGRETGAVP